MSQSHAARHREGGGGMSPTTLLAAKVAFAVAAAGSAARLVAPHVVAAAGAVVPRVWAVARFWLAPPYLLVTVHLIILVIWKLSDRKQHFQAHPWPVAHPPPPAGAEEPVTVAKEAEFYAHGAGGHVDSDYPSPEFSPDSGGGDADSSVTTESDEDASSSSYHYYFVEATTTTSSVPPAQERAAVLEREPSQTTVDGGDDDDLDATWNAIMQKTRSARQSPPPRAWDPSVGAEEMNRRFDDFIKKNRHSFRRQ